jgi:hypothetical protein
VQIDSYSKGNPTAPLQLEPKEPSQQHCYEETSKPHIQGALSQVVKKQCITLAHTHHNYALTCMHAHVKTPVHTRMRFQERERVHACLGSCVSLYGVCERVYSLSLSLSHTHTKHPHTHTTG